MNLTVAALAEKKSEDKSDAENGGLIQYLGKHGYASVDVRHILVQPEGGTKDDDGNITYSDEEWEACRKEAQALLDQYLAGEKTADAFGALANEHSDDQNGKVTNGGLYEDVYKGDMVAAFDQWIFDDSRVPGETGLVKTPYGYHVMYFVHRDGAVDAWAFAEDRKVGDYALVRTDNDYQILYFVAAEEGWRVWCENNLRQDTMEEMRKSYTDERPMDARYWAMLLSQRTEAQEAE